MMLVGVDIIILHDFTFLPLALVFLLDEHWTHIITHAKHWLFDLPKGCWQEKWNRFMESERNVDVGDTLC